MSPRAPHLAQATMPLPFPAAKNRVPLIPAEFAIFAKFANFGMIDALLGHPASRRQI
jgi:hypothetical protein